MSSQEPAIVVKDLYKSFRLPHEKHNGVKQVVLNVFNRKKGFETQKVLNDVSFEIKKGEFFGIVGRNGSGKSTLLKLLANIYTPDKGLVQVNGSLTPFIELGVGFNPELTGRENVYMNGALLGFGRAEMDAMYNDIVTFAELEKFMDQKLKNYSSGMQVRLAFSIAIQAQSDILLLDEVLAVGDAAFQKKCFDYFRELKRAKRTVVFISHDMNAVREYCDRAILVDHGRVVAEGNVDDIALKYTKLFLNNNKKAAFNDDAKRWGTNGATIDNVDYKATKNEITVTAKVTFHEKVEDPIFGVHVTNPFGMKVVENNTRWAEVHTGSFETGDKAELTWKFPHILTNGRNYVTVAVCDHDASEYYDWYEDALVIEVDKQLVTTALTLPGDTITVSKERK